MEQFNQWTEGQALAEIAERLGVSKAYVCQLEAGARVPSLAMAVRIERESGGKVPCSAWATDSRQRASA